MLSSLFSVRRFHTVPHYIKNSHQQVKGAIVCIPPASKTVITSNDHLLKPLSMINTEHCLIIKVFQSVLTEEQRGRFIVVGSPHVYAGIVNRQFVIYPGTGMSKGFNAKQQPSKVRDLQLGNRLLVSQQFEVSAVYHSDKAIQAMMMSQVNGGVSLFGGRHFAIMIDLAMTNIVLNGYVDRIRDEKEINQIYDRHNDHCCHSLYRVLTGKSSDNKKFTETQSAVIEMVSDITRDQDEHFSANFIAGATEVGLVEPAEEISKRYQIG